MLEMWHGGNPVLDTISDICVVIMIVCVVLIVISVFLALYKWADRYDNEFRRQCIREEELKEKHEKEERRHRQKMRCKYIKRRIEYFLQGKKW